MKRKLDESKKRNPDQQKDGEKKDGEEKDGDKKEGDNRMGRRKMVKRKMASRTENSKEEGEKKEGESGGDEKKEDMKAKKDQPGKKTRKVRRKARGKVKAGKKRTVTKSRPRKIQQRGAPPAEAHPNDRQGSRTTHENDAFFLTHHFHELFGFLGGHLDGLQLAALLAAGFFLGLLFVTVLFFPAFTFPLAFLLTFLVFFPG